MELVHRLCKCMFARLPLAHLEAVFMGLLLVVAAAVAANDNCEYPARRRLIVEREQ